MASAEVNVISDCGDRREDDHQVRLLLEAGVPFSSCFPPSSPSLL